MGKVSYAQNNEDIMLWRAFENIEKGYYIDVGANSPVADSVTKLFYNNGWNGINIEPVLQWFEEIAEDRKRDINLPIAASDKVGQVDLYELPETGLSTTNISIAQRHERERGYTKIKRTVPTDTLTNICNKHHQDKAIHFLKIDVEGAEKEVIAGLDLEKIRPWIIVIESTIPNQKIEDHSSWEGKILKCSYQFVYFDGLNRYYISNEKKHLASHFKSPPNIFDDFITYPHHLCQQQTKKDKDVIQELKDTLDVQRSEYQKSRAELKSVYSSYSWVMTAPLRRLKNCLNNIKNKGI